MGRGRVNSTTAEVYGRDGDGKKGMGGRSGADEMELECNLENLNVNLGRNVRPAAKVSVLPSGYSLNVQNLKFNKLATGCLRKRDRYREIFGDKPKIVMVKV